MRKFLVAAALCSTSASWASDGHLNAPMFSVDYTAFFSGLCVGDCSGESALSIQGNRVDWATHLNMQSLFVGSVPGRAEGLFDFVATLGYAITGYDITYDISFSTPAHIADGSEYDLYANPPRHLVPGTVIGGTGAFHATTGAVGAFDYLRRGAMFTDHETGATLSPLTAVLTAANGEYCTNIPILCASAGLVTLPGRMTLNSITIAPILAAVPEPGTYALLGAGLLMVLCRRPARAKAGHAV